MRAGESITLGGLGVATLIRSASDPERDPVEFVFELRPGAPGPPPHVHPHQEERWEVIEGVLDARIGGERRRLGAGETVSIPAGTAHGFRAGRGRRLRFHDIHLPARGFQSYMEALGEVLSRGGERDPRTLLRLARLVHAQAEDQVPAGAVGRSGVAVAAAAARVLGLK